MTEIDTLLKTPLFEHICHLFFQSVRIVLYLKFSYLLTWPIISFYTSPPVGEITEKNQRLVRLRLYKSRFSKTTPVPLATQKIASSAT